MCVLLIAAYAFRWEQGPTQADKDLKIIHMKDRWTGQAWVSLYGQSNGKLYSGEMEPIPTQQSIQERKTQILSSPEAIQYKEDLNTKIQEYQKERDLHTAGYNECNRIIQSNNRLKLDFTISALSKLELMATVPKDIYDEHAAWLNANKLLNQATSELGSQPIQAEEKAESELKTWALQERKIVTYMWFTLFGSSIVATALLARNKPKKEA